MSNVNRGKKRQPISDESQAEVLTKSCRRCCICYGINQDYTEKRGQIAHLDKNPANNAISNLAFLCFDHHDQYDSSTSQSKNYTKQEVTIYRDRLYQHNAPASIENVNPEILLKKKEMFRKVLERIQRERGNFVILSSDAPRNYNSELHRRAVEDYSWECVKEDVEHLHLSEMTPDPDLTSTLLQAIEGQDAKATLSLCDILSNRLNIAIKQFPV